MDLISARTDEGRRIAVEQLRGGLSEKISEFRDRLIESFAFVEAHIDFPEDEIEVRTIEQIISRLKELRQEIAKLSETFQEARFFREGLSVAIVGRPNVGKSSLLNALLKKERAIVTEIPGTTRDLIEDYLDIQGLPVRIIDTAGIRRSEEMIEREGIRRSLDAMQHADFVIAVFDGSGPAEKEDMELIRKIKDKNAIIAINKSDLPLNMRLEDVAASGKEYLHISASNGDGLDELKSSLFNANLKNWKEEREWIVVTNLRHKLALDRTCSALANAVEVLGGNQPLEIFSIEMREALDSIGEITGAVTSDDILNKIFTDFCIGK
jgi:tRNA modification GTPase